MSDRGPGASLKTSGFIVLRTPLIPFEELTAWSAGLEAPAAAGDPERLERAFAGDRARLRDRLRAVVERPEVREALFLASPDLDETLDVWLRDPEGDRGLRIERALTRYFTRMAGRPTPFGLFAGCSVGRLGERTLLEIGARPAYRRHTRLDMDYLCALAEAAAGIPEIRNLLVYRPSSGLYQTSGGFRYAEAKRRDKSRTYHLVALDRTPYLEATLERCRRGARLQELAEALVGGEDGVTMQEAWEYVNELVESQVLVADLQAAVTGPEPVHGLLGELRGHAAAAAIAGRLERATRDLLSRDEEGLGAAAGRYRELAADLAELPVAIDPKRLFQVDMVKPAPRLVLGRQVLDDVVRGVEVLHRLAPPNLDTLFAGFREAFLARYEGREVPLVEALDEEAGVGFRPSRAAGAEGSPLLQGLAFPPADAQPASWRLRDVLLLRKLEEAARAGAREIRLDEEDLRRMGTEDPPPLPDAFAATVVVAAASEASFARGEHRLLLKYATGPSGARLLGRFCHADESLRARVEDHLREEEACDPDAVFAEVVHLPEGRLGNILCRPVLRGYEIPYLGRSGAPPERQIPITDLLVSVEGGRIVLRSARLGRRVIPRLSSAHSYPRRGQGIYRFLCSLQDQGVCGGLGWTWGALESARFLPRVAVGRLVLSSARWRIDRETLRSLGGGRGAGRFAAVQRWRSAWGLPRWIDLVESDHELPIDLDNALCVETFVEGVRRRDSAIVKEMFPGPDELCVTGPEGRFVHEIVVPFVRAAPPRASPPSRGPRAAGSVERRFTPGSEWLYAKIYTGSASADRVLREAVGPVARGAFGSAVVDRWFFIRYVDPDPHLRLRLRGAPEALGSMVLPALHAALRPLVDDGLVWRVQIDTYEREVERYGGAEAVEIAEAVFQADSEAVLAILDLVEGDDGADARWRLALPGIDLLLSDMGLDLGARRAVVQRQRDGLRRELHAGKALAIQMGARFRKERASLEPLLDRRRDAQSALAAGLAALAERSRSIAAAVERLTALERSGRLAASLEELAGSYVHMHVNRLLRSAHRPQELVLYDFLDRLYGSRAARTAAGDAGRKDAALQP